MAVTITKQFWNSTDTQYDTISKIVFTSPNIDSPAVAGTRSYILPGSEYIGTWYESSSNMHRIKWDQELPDKQEIYFDKLYLNQDVPFNFNIDTSVSVRSLHPTTFGSGQIVSYSNDEYGIIAATASGGAVSFGGTSLGTIFDSAPLNGSACCDSTYIYRIKTDSTTIYRYDISNNFWEEYIDAPDTFTVNSSIVKVGSKLYCVRGQGTTFWEYNISTSSWKTLQSLSSSVDSYTYMNSFDGLTILYLKAGSSGQIIREYTISSDLWSDFFTPALSGYSQVWYGPTLYKYDGNYYTWCCTKTGDNAAVRYVKMDVGGITTSEVGSYAYQVTLSGSSILGFYAYGDSMTDTTTSGTEILKSFGHYYMDRTTTEDTAFVYAIHHESSGIDVIPSAGGGYVECFDKDDLSFEVDDSVKPEVATIVADDDFFYFFDHVSTSSGTHMYRYNLVSSNTNEANMVVCNTTKGYMPGESYFDTKASNLTYKDDVVYFMEGPYANSIWGCTISGSWTNYSGYAEPTASGTDREFFTQPYSCIGNDGTYLYILKGENYSDFYRYDTVSGTMITLSGSPGVMGKYGGMTYVSAADSLYVLQGQGSNSLWRYDISSNTWYVRTGAPSSFAEKCSIHHPTYGGDSIFAVRGEGHSSFWEYSISGNSWTSSLDGLVAYNELGFGLGSRGTGASDGKIYSINSTTVYEYAVNTDAWTTVEGSISYSESDKRFVLDAAGSYIYAFGDEGLKQYELDDLSSAATQSSYDITFSSVVGTSVVGTDEALYTWLDGLSNTSIWAHSQNTVIFEVTNGEAYDCRLTAWDDDTHATTSNKILDESHYKVVVAAFRAAGGTKQEPECADFNNVMVYPAGIDVILKGNSSYYGDFDLIHIANGGVSGQEHGEYLIFVPRLHNITSAFTSGNYDFVTTLHYQYT